MQRLTKPSKIINPGSGLGGGAEHGRPDEGGYRLPSAGCCFADLLVFMGVNACSDQCLPLPVF